MPVDRLYGQSGRDIVSAPAVAQPQPVNCRSPAADEPRPGGRRSRGDRTWRSPARPASHARRLPCCRRRLRRADPAAAQEQDPGHVPTLPPCGTTAPRLKASLTVVRPNPARRASRVFVRPNVTSPASRRARNSLSVRRRILNWDGHPLPASRLLFDGVHLRPLAPRCAGASRHSASCSTAQSEGGGANSSQSPYVQLAADRLAGNGAHQRVRWTRRSADRRP